MRYGARSHRLCASWQDRSGELGQTRCSTTMTKSEVERMGGVAAAGVSPAVKPAILPGGLRNQPAYSLSDCTYASLRRGPGYSGGETPPSTSGGTPDATQSQSHALAPH